MTELIDQAPPTLAEQARAALGKRNLVLIGLMGAGKSAIGRMTAQALGVPFVDSDHEIERVSRMSITDLFAAYGEAEFRALETRVIKRLLRSGPRVVSTGPPVCTCIVRASGGSVMRSGSGMISSCTRRSGKERREAG